MRSLLGIMVQVALLMVAAEAPAQSLNPAKPQGQWIVDFADNHCLAGHEFMTDYGKTIFQFQPDMLRRNATINIIVPKNEKTDRPWGEMKIDWEGRSDEVTAQPRFRVMKLPDDKRVVTFSMATEGLEKMAVLDLRVSFEKNSGFAFQLPNWANLQTLLDQCASDLRESKGFPGPEYDLVSTHSKSKIINFVREDDYPAAALKNNEQGDVWVLFWVETNGRVSDCIIDKSSGSKSLDAKTCQVVRRARFEPARGKDGKPIREPNSTRLSWYLGN